MQQQTLTSPGVLDAHTLLPLAINAMHDARWLLGTNPQNCGAAWAALDEMMAAENAREPGTKSARLTATPALHPTSCGRPRRRPAWISRRDGERSGQNSRGCRERNRSALPAGPAGFWC